MEKYLPDDFRQKIIEKISTEVVSCIMEQIKYAINQSEIEERAKLASEGYDDDGYSAGLYMGYKVGATEQKVIDIDKACNIFCHTGCPHKTDSYNCLNNKCDTWKIFRRMTEK